MKVIATITIITFCLSMLPCCGELKGHRPDGVDGCDDHGGGDVDDDGGDDDDTHYNHSKLYDMTLTHEIPSAAESYSRCKKPSQYKKNRTTRIRGLHEVLDGTKSIPCYAPSEKHGVTMIQKKQIMQCLKVQSNDRIWGRESLKRNLQETNKDGSP
jgi:hypothetical protein